MTKLKRFAELKPAGSAFSAARLRTLCFRRRFALARQVGAAAFAFHFVQSEGWWLGRN